MTDIPALLAEIREQLTGSFTRIDAWFDKDEGVRSYQPSGGGWSVNQILERIGLTNFFLLKLIRRGTQKALLNTRNLDLSTELVGYKFHREKLTEIGIHRSFDWVRPEHMEPRGEKSLPEVRQQLREQLAECLGCLDQLRHGEGVLYRTTMTVNGLGKIDVYEYLYFLAQHGQRHVTQMQRNEQEAKQTQPSST